MSDLLSNFIAAFIKVFLPFGYGAWFLKLASDNFDGQQLLIFVPVYLLSLVGVWKLSLVACRLADRAIARLLAK